MEEAHI
jgi:hypothetical protein